MIVLLIIVKILIKIGEINGRLLDENEENLDLDSTHDHPSIGRDLHLAQNSIHQSHPRYALDH